MCLYFVLEVGIWSVRAALVVVEYCGGGYIVKIWGGRELVALILISQEVETGRVVQRHACRQGGVDCELQRGSECMARARIAPVCRWYSYNQQQSLLQTALDSHTQRDDDEFMVLIKRAFPIGPWKLYTNIDT